MVGLPEWYNNRTLPEWCNNRTFLVSVLTNNDAEYEFPYLESQGQGKVLADLDNLRMKAQETLACKKIREFFEKIEAEGRKREGKSDQEMISRAMSDVWPKGEGYLLLRQETALMERVWGRQGLGLQGLQPSEEEYERGMMYAMSQIKELQTIVYVENLVKASFESTTAEEWAYKVASIPRSYSYGFQGFEDFPILIDEKEDLFAMREGIPEECERIFSLLSLTNEILANRVGNSSLSYSQETVKRLLDSGIFDILVAHRRKINIVLHTKELAASSYGRDLAQSLGLPHSLVMVAYEPRNALIDTTVFAALKSDTLAFNGCKELKQYVVELEEAEKVSALLSTPLSSEEFAGVQMPEGLKIERQEDGNLNVAFTGPLTEDFLTKHSTCEYIPYPEVYMTVERDGPATLVPTDDVNAVVTEDAFTMAQAFRGYEGFAPERFFNKTVSHGDPVYMTVERDGPATVVEAPQGYDGFDGFASNRFLNKTVPTISEFALAHPEEFKSMNLGTYFLVQTVSKAFNFSITAEFVASLGEYWEYILVGHKAWEECIAIARDIAAILVEGHMFIFKVVGFFAMKKLLLRGWKLSILPMLCKYERLFLETKEERLVILQTRNNIRRLKEVWRIVATSSVFTQVRASLRNSLHGNKSISSVYACTQVKEAWKFFITATLCSEFRRSLGDDGEKVLLLFRVKEAKRYNESNLVIVD